MLMQQKYQKISLTDVITRLQSSADTVLADWNVIQSKPTLLIVVHLCKKFCKHYY
jgi:hypothetical protein